MHAIGKHREEIIKGRAEPPQGLFLPLYTTHATISQSYQKSPQQGYDFIGHLPDPFSFFLTVRISSANL